MMAVVYLAFLEVPALSPEAQYDCVEVFAGAGALTRCLQCAGFQTCSLDIGMWWPWMEARGLKTKRIRKSCTGNPLDLLSPAGFALVCSSFVAISRGSTFRSYFLPHGDVSSPSVAKGNLLAYRTYLAMLLVMAKKGVWVLEQPFSSLVFRMDCFQKMCRTTKVFKQSFWMRGWGSSTAKRTTLWANSSAVRFFSTTKKAKGKKSSKKLADIYYDASGRKRYKGNKALRASQQYPIGFGVRFAQTVKHLKNERSPLLDHSYAPCSSFIRNFDVMPGKGHRCRKCSNI